MLSRLALIPALAALMLACGSTGTNSTQATYPTINSGSLGEMRNVSTMGSIWFGAMPCEQDLDLARRRGIERVIDLSTPDEKGKCSIAAVCSRLDLEYLAAAIRAEGQPSDESVDFVIEWIAEGFAQDSGSTRTPPRTLMVDGSGGRSACFLAIYRTLELKVPLEEALVEARRAGMKPGAPEDFVRSQVARIKKKADLADAGA